MIPDVQPTGSVVAAGPTALRIHAIILAAGRGARMGGPKALLALEGVTAVIGHEADRVRREAALPADVVTIMNTHYAEGMLTSILCGLGHADAAGADAVLVHPVDHPLVEAATV